MDNAKRHADCMYSVRLRVCANTFQAKIRSTVVGCLSLLPVAPLPVSDPPVSFFGQSVGCAEIARWCLLYSVRTQGEENRPPWRFQCAEIYPIVGGLREEQGQLQQTHSQQGL